MNDFSKTNVDNFQKQIAKQPNEFSTAIFKGTAMSYRIIIFALFKIAINKIQSTSLDNKCCTFSQSEFCESLGMPIGSNTAKVIEKATNELTQSFITLENKNPKNETDSCFTKITWFQKVEILKNGDIALSFNNEIAKYFEFKLGYTALELLEIGNLRSFYAIRFYSLAKSKSGYKGIKGNNANEWWFEYTEDELRTLFEINNKKYIDRRKFVEKVIKQPCEEINNKTNLKISLTYSKLSKGKYLWRFNCSPKISEPVKIQIEDRTDIREEKREINAERTELEIFKEKYPEQFLKALELIKAKNQYPVRLQINDEYEAVKLLKNQVFCNSNT